MYSKKEIQKTSYSLAQLEMDMKNLTSLHNHPPCICISGLRSLTLVQMVKHGDFRNVIYALFRLLRIPEEWILEIRNAPHSSLDSSKIPFEAYIFLIDNHIKLRVYKLILNHLKHTKQNKIHIRIVD
jgi:hypothetical protein